MNRKILITISNILLILLINSLCFANTSNLPQEQNSLLLYKILFAISIVISGYGLYSSKKRNIVVFANMTDICMTGAIPGIALLLYFICLFFELSSGLTKFLIIISTLVFICIVIRSTYLYNKSVNVGIVGYAIALFTKFFLISFFISFYIIFWLFGHASRAKGETTNHYIDRNKKHMVSGLTSISAVFMLLSYLGLWEKKFIYISDYIGGNWGK